MMAILYQINSDNPQQRLIDKVAEILRKDGVIAYPTDTVYGIGCDIFCKKAIDKIFSIKGKSHKSPLSFICPDLKDISKYAYVSNRAYKVMRHLLPGPYTFVLKATPLVPKLMVTRIKTVGIRIPDNNIYRSPTRIRTSSCQHQRQFRWIRYFYRSRGNRYSSRSSNGCHYWWRNSWNNYLKRCRLNQWWWFSCTTCRKRRC